MDITHTYKRMCRESSHLQEEWRPREGDFAFAKRDFTMIVGNDCQAIPVKKPRMCVLHQGWRFNDARSNPKSCVVWMPRIDQLLAMIVPVLHRADRSHVRQGDVLLWVAHGLVDAANRSGKHGGRDTAVSIEQELLTMWMYEKHRMRWTGTTWK